MVVRILFVCHGNICRSPMAEFITKDLIGKRALTGYVTAESCATSNEEIGNDIYPPVRRVLSDHGIAFEHRIAGRMTVSDYEDNNLIIAMDRYNISNMRGFVKGDPDRKVRLMMSFVGEDNDVDDPWYSGDFERTFDDLSRACNAMLSSLHLDE